MTKRKIEYWVIPPEADAEFVANMEEVLETYEKPYDPSHPVVCMDEQPVQLIKETRQAIAATKNHPRRVDCEYACAGTACIFMFTEPLSGWREAIARLRRTNIDWAIEMANLLGGRYADGEKLILGSDNLNTHTKGVFYEVFEPAKARRSRLQRPIRRAKRRARCGIRQDRPLQSRFLSRAIPERCCHWQHPCSSPKSLPGSKTRRPR